MMSNYISIDGGTTNTRINLVKDKKITDTLKYGVGAGNSIEDKDVLRNTIKRGINEILQKNRMQKSEITRILASGMLTSELGICQLDHIKTPVGIKELHDAAAGKVLDDITDIPFVFMRGVKTDDNSLDGTDMMRGEETELMGIFDKPCEGCIYVLPGSHSKIIKTDNEGRITDFTTTVTGEMIAALSQHTILKECVRLDIPSFDEKFLKEGFDYCRRNGINKAAFKVRVLKNMFCRSDKEIYSFFIGTVLCGEILEIIKLNPSKIVIGGKKQIKAAMFEILKQETDCEVVCISDSVADAASTLGMIKIFEYGM